MVMDSESKEETQRTSRWEGYWIWSRDAGGDYAFACFRKTFTVSGGRADARLYLTASDKYHVFVNGRRVGIGPHLAHYRRKRYDIYDVSSTLRAGENVLAVLASHQAKRDNRIHHVHKYRGLLCQLDIGGEAVCVSDTTWKARPCPAFTEPSVRMGVTFLPEFFDARQYQPGWELPGYDDSSWPAAIAALRETHQPLFNCFCQVHAARIFPWVNVIPSELEPLRYTQCRPAAIVSAGEVIEHYEPSWNNTAERMSIEHIQPLTKAVVERPERLIEGAEGCEVRCSDAKESFDTFDGLRDPTIILDFGRVMNARLGFRLDCDGATVVDIGYATRLIDGRVVPYTPHSQADQYLAAPGGQSWQSFDWRQFRYVQLTFRHANSTAFGAAPCGRIALLELWAEQVEYPFERRGGFECDSALVNRAVEATRLTAELTTVGNMMDNANRERRHHTGDCAPLLRTIYSFFGQCGMVKRYFRQCEENRDVNGWYENATGLVGGVYDNGLLVPPYLYEYYLLTGDRGLLEELAPGLELAARFMDSCLDGDGRVTAMPYFSYFDWGYTLRNRQSFLLHAYLADALKASCRVFEIIGMDFANARRMETVRRVQKRLKKEYFDEKRGVFLDLPRVSEQNNIGQQANSYALCSDIATPEQMRAVCAAWEEHPEWFSMANAGWYSVAPGLLRAGRPDLCLAWVERHFGKVFARGLETVPENWSDHWETTAGSWRTRNDRSAVQGAGVVGLPYALLTGLCGIEPLDPGFAAARFAPNAGPLREFRGDFPVEGGTCSLSFRRGEGGDRIEISVPERVKRVLLDLPCVEPDRRVLVDGEPVDPDDRATMPWGAVVPRMGFENRRAIEVFVPSSHI